MNALPDSVTAPLAPHQSLTVVQEETAQARYLRRCHSRKACQLSNGLICWPYQEPRDQTPMVPGPVVQA